jgi:MFS transporter, DHA1 family, inner membrane transport protein
MSDSAEPVASSSASGNPAVADHAPPRATAVSTRLLLWSLMFGNLVIGTGFMLPVGILHLIADAQSVTVVQAGALMWAGGIVIAVGAPTMAWATSRIDRRTLLVGALLLYVVGHALSALATSFTLLLALRLVTLLSVAIFGAQSAATVGLVVPPERRAAAMALLFTGWAIAVAVGMPATSWVGAQVGWQAAFWMVSAASLIALLMVAIELPRGLTVPRVSLRTWVEVARNPVLTTILAVSVLLMVGQFTLFTYIAPEIDRRLYPSPTLVAWLLACWGIAGVVGSVIASRISARFTPSQLVLAGLGTIIAGLLCVAIAPRLPAFYAASFFVWGLASFVVQAQQQARLIAARSPLASATVALNSSAIYVGQGLGGVVGGLMLTAGVPDRLPELAALLLVAAMIVSLLADRLAAATPRQ